MKVEFTVSENDILQSCDYPKGTLAYSVPWNTVAVNAYEGWVPLYGDRSLYPPSATIIRGHLLKKEDKVTLTQTSIAFGNEEDE